MLKVAVGHSDDPDSQAAIDEVLQQCTDSWEPITPKAGILFAAIDYDHALILQQINQAFPGLELIGGTTDGEISSVLEFQEDSLTFMVFGSDEMDIYAGIGRHVSQDAIAATQQAVQQATSQTPHFPKFCLSIPESLTTSGVSILEGLKQALGLEVPIFGGLAADQLRFQQTYQFFKTEVLSDAVPILVFSGSVLFSHGVANGWHPVGKRSRVTKVDKNVVYEIDGQPALEFYHYYLGALPPSIEYPLAVFNGDNDQDQSFYMRAPSSYDPASGSITFFADIPDQALVQITEANREAILEASQTSMRTAMQNYPGVAPEAALFFSCTARRQILGTRAYEEYALAKGTLAQVIPGCGFYTNGEIAPLQQHGQTQFHNEAFVTVLLGTK